MCSKRQFWYTGINQFSSHILGLFTCQIEVLGNKIELIFHVIDKNTNNFYVLLGRNFLNHKDIGPVIISKGKIEITVKTESVDQYQFPFSEVL